MNTPTIRRAVRPDRGLSELQRKILDTVKRKGHTTTFDTINLTLSFNPDFTFKQGMRSAYASASRALRRLVDRGLLMKLRSQYVGYSDVFVLPDFEGDIPDVKRRYGMVEMYKMDFAGITKRLNSSLTVRGDACG